MIKDALALIILAADPSGALSVKDVLTLLLGGGATATVVAIFKGVKSIQSGARARERETYNELVKQRKAAWKERDFANKSLDYWRSRAGTVEFLARQNGTQLPEFDLPPEPEDDDD